MNSDKKKYVAFIAFLAATVTATSFLSRANGKQVDGIELTTTKALDRQVGSSDLVSIPDPETRSERSISPEQEVMEMNEEFHAREDWGHPDYGDFPSQQRLESALLSRASVAISKGKNPEERLENWIKSQSYWLSSDGHVNMMPLESLGVERPLTGEETQILNDAVAPINSRIREECIFARDQLQLAAQEFVYSRMKKVPRGEPYQPDYGENGELRGRYSAFSTMNKGVWTYIIDFRSHDFPALEDSLASIQTMRAERRTAAEVAIGQFID